MADTNKIYVGGSNTQPKNIYIQNDKVKQIYKGNDLLYSMSEEYTNKIRFNIYTKSGNSNSDIYFSYSNEHISTTPSNKLYSKYTQQDVPIDNLLGQDKMDGKTSYYYYIHPYDPYYYKNTSYSYINTLNLSNLDINKFFAYSKGLFINDLSNSSNYYCSLIFDGCDFSKIGNIYINTYIGIYQHNHPYGLYARGAKFKNSSYLEDILNDFASSEDAWSTNEPFNNYFRSLDIRNVRFESEPKTLNSYALFWGQNRASTIDFSNDIIKGNTSMKLMFGGCRSLTSLDVSKWDVSSVTDMGSMFINCESLTSLDVSKWDVSSVTDMNSMFCGCRLLTSLDVSKWDVSSVTDMNSMFYDCGIKDLDVSNWDVSSVTDMGHMFDYSSNKDNYLSSLDVSKWDVSKVTKMYYMFSCQFDISELDVSKWDVSSVTNMCGMFGMYLSNKSSKLTSLDVSKWDVSSVTDMSNMFYKCVALTSLDLSNWDVSNVTNMSYIFEGCTELKTLIAGHESNTNITTLNGLKVDIDLSYCTKLNGQSIMAIFRGLATLSTGNEKTITLPNKVKDNAIVKLNIELVAESKHWNIVYK